MQPTPAPSTPPRSPRLGKVSDPVDTETYPVPPQNTGTAPFSILAGLFEKLQVERKHDRRRKMLDSWFTHWRREKGYDLYPVLRLVLPQKDRERAVYGLKEKNLAKTYIKLIPLGIKDPDAIRLLNWKKPTERTVSSGDFPTVLYDVVNKRSSVIEGSLSIEELNEILNELAKNMGQQDVQSKILQRVYNRSTPNEQKWIVRIILKDMNISVKETTVFSVLHPDAQDLYNTCSDLKKVAWELWDPSHRLNAENRSVQLFHSFAPMLCKRPNKRIEETVKEMGGGDFYMEEKLDGERMQLHKRGNEYFYCSRKGKDYTYLYGKHVGIGSLTPYIDPAFDSRIDSIILDGEMLVWDPVSERNLPFGTLKTAALDKSNNHHNPRPCFKVFDLLYMNGQPILHRSLAFRKRNLRQCLKEVKGRVEFAAEFKGKTAKDVRSKMDEVMVLRGEGLVIKHPASKYVLNGRNMDWIKVKPEYMDNMGETMDLLVVSGNYGSGKRSGGVSTLICAVLDDRHREDDDDMSLYSTFVRVGTGFSYADYVWIRSKSWKTWDKKSPPAFLRTSQRGYDDKGDLYLEPEDGMPEFVPCIHTNSLMISDQYHLGFTMRFPRAIAIRDDLSSDDCMTATAVLESLRTEKKRKMEGDVGEIEMIRVTKKRKTQAKRITVLPQYQGPRLKDVTKESSIFEGLTFVVVSDPKSRTADEERNELLKLICANGGDCAQMVFNQPNLLVIYGGTTTPYDLKLIMSKGKYDIIKPSWITDSVLRGHTAPFHQKYFFHATEKRKQSTEYGAQTLGAASEQKVMTPTTEDVFEIPVIQQELYTDTETQINSALTEWLKYDKKDIEGDNDSTTEADEDSDNADVNDEDPGDEWVSITPILGEKDDVELSSPVKMKMGESPDAMEYDTNLIFKHLCFYLDTPGNARNSGMLVKFKNEEDVESNFSSIFELITENGGRIVPIDEPKLTHVVLDKRDISRRIELMQRTCRPKRRHLVISEYVRACLDEGTLLDEDVCTVGCIEMHVATISLDMANLQVSPISQMLYTLGMTREDLSKRSHEMRQFLTSQESPTSRVAKHSATCNTRCDSVESTGSISRSISRPRSSSLRELSPPTTPVKTEPHESSAVLRHGLRMDYVMERKRRYNKKEKRTRREKERELTMGSSAPHPPSPSPSSASHTSLNLDSFMHSRDDRRISNLISMDEKSAAVPVTPQKGSYYRDHTHLSSSVQPRKETKVHPKAETPTPTRSRHEAMLQDQSNPRSRPYSRYPSVSDKSTEASTSQIPVTPQKQRGGTFSRKDHVLGSSSPALPLSPISSPSRAIVNLVSSPGPMGPLPREEEYDKLPYKLPPGPYSPTKPDLSYAALVGQAILSSPEHRLTLQEIYDWITIVYPHYKRGETTWMNSIRHVLSTTACFRKVPRDRSVGRTLWAIWDEDLDCFEGGGFRKHLCKDIVKVSQSNSKGKGKARKRSHGDEDVTPDRKSKRVRKNAPAPDKSRTPTLMQTSYRASLPLSHPLFPPSRPTPHHQPYYESCMIQPQPLPAEIIFPPLPPTAYTRISGAPLSTQASTQIPSRESPYGNDLPSDPPPPPSDASSVLLVPELTPNCSSSSPPSLPSTSEVDLDDYIDMNQTVYKGQEPESAGRLPLSSSDVASEPDTSNNGDCEDVDGYSYSSTTLGPVQYWGETPKKTGIKNDLNSGVKLMKHGHKKNSEVSVRLVFGFLQIVSALRIVLQIHEAFPPVPTSPTLELRALRATRPPSREGDFSGTPPSSTSYPATPPARNATLQLSSVRTPISHKGLHMSPSTSLAHYKTNLDPPPVHPYYSECVEGPSRIEAEETDPMRTPQKRTAMLAPPVTPKRPFSNQGDSPFRTPLSGLATSPFRTPGARNIFDPHDPGALLDEELSRNAMDQDDSPIGLYGRGRGSLLYDSPGALGSPGKWSKWW
ncbi:hypothetical protein AMATHDRAFT_74590 [Amanita thiersii Skay4041]|uniref:DNA ligase n=1 Tax=Amanita thiersii Skay4041 TaxID=703135 RepID=A0A2A9NW16_9AGAR|nr:hypothetical protein AMATHDRAFT_74590 [Amanita thiersii Skay4041]